jgi:hypothetical protein
LIETRDFAIPSDENVGEIHRQIAQKRRNGNMNITNQNILLSSAYDVFNVIEASGPLGAGTPPTQAQIQFPNGT